MSHPLYDLLRRLEEDHVYFTISRHRDDSIMITATYVGERLEIDVFEDGHMEVSRFKGSEDILGDSDLAYRILDDGVIERPLCWQGLIFLPRESGRHQERDGEYAAAASRSAGSLSGAFAAPKRPEDLRGDPEQD
jgi:hypothetical protein